MDLRDPAAGLDPYFSLFHGKPDFLFFASTENDIQSRWLFFGRQIFAKKANIFRQMHLNCLNQKITFHV